MVKTQTAARCLVLSDEMDAQCQEAVDSSCSKSMMEVIDMLCVPFGEQDNIMLTGVGWEG
jgi:hypothetical protein